MHQLMDHVDIDSGRAGTVVRMSKQLGRRDEEEPLTERAILKPLGRLLSRERSA